MIINIIKESKNSNIIKMDREFQEATNQMREFMFKNVYIGSKAKKKKIKRRI